MPADVQRGLGPSTSQSSTGTAIGHAEDYSNILTNIDPKGAPFLTHFGRAANGTELDWSWFATRLNPPKVNAYPEKMDYTFAEVGSIEGLHNYQQHFYTSGYVTDAQRMSKMIFAKDDFTREKEIAFLDHAHDIEYAIAKNRVAHGETAADGPAMTGGVPYFMSLKTLDATLDATKGLVTTTASHHLKTGDFVFFTATTMPGNMSADKDYYVYVPDGSTNTFYIYNNIEGAVEQITTAQVIPESAGTDVKVNLSNVLDLNNEAEFTIENVNTVLHMASLRGGSPTEMYMSPYNKRRFSQLTNALATTYRKPSDEKITEIAVTYESDFGVVNAHSHYRYGDDRIDIFDMNYNDIKWFDPTHAVSGLAKTGTYEKFAIESWVGYQATQPKANASIINCKR